MIRGNSWRVGLLAIASIGSSAAVVRAQNTGACCVGSQCYEGAVYGTQAWCDSVGGIFHGVGSSCAGVTCVGGACCNFGSCTDGWNQSLCDGHFGVFHGLGSACATVTCVFGACCDGVGCYDAMTQSACAQGGAMWLWRGWGTNCATSGCATGACLLGSSGAGGCCVDFQQHYCTNYLTGTWHPGVCENYPDFPGCGAQNIPTVSGWALVVMTGLILVVATLVIRTRNYASTA